MTEPICFSCGKRLWPPEADGKLAIVDGDRRCQSCIDAKRNWDPRYFK